MLFTNADSLLDKTNVEASKSVVTSYLYKSTTTTTNGTSLLVSMLLITAFNTNKAFLIEHNIALE